MSKPTYQEIKDAAIEAAKREGYQHPSVISIKPLFSYGQVESWLVTMIVSEYGRRYSGSTKVKWLGKSYFAEPTITLLGSYTE